MARRSDPGKGRAGGGRNGQGPGAPANPMLEQVGPDFHDDASLAEALGGPPPAHGVLALPTADERRIYPVWQVVDGAVLPGLAEVLAAFAGHPAWSVALWLTTEHDDLGSTTPVAWLTARGDAATVVTLAGDTAQRWA